MRIWSRLAVLSRSLWLAALVALLAVLAGSVWLLRQELDHMRAIYLRNRAASLAARLESMEPGAFGAGLVASLSAEEPYLLDAWVSGRQEGEVADPALSDLWNGRALYRTEEFSRAGERAFRAYVPFHSRDGLRIARLDISFAAADFLTSHARRHLGIAIVMGTFLVLLSTYAVWSTRRAARLEKRHLQLEHLARLGKMAAMLAHEIRNPLGTMKGFVQLAAESAAPQLRALLDPVVVESLRLENLVNDLLLYGRPPEPSLRAVDWTEFQQGLAAHARQLIGFRPIRFTSQPSRLSLRTDPGLLKQVLLNLIRNSIEAVAEGTGSEVRLSISAGDGASVSIAVEDDGPGVPNEIRDKIWEAFFTTRSSGTGLGLPIAARLTEALGGRIQMQPASPRGTRTVLRFPGAHRQGLHAEEGAAWKASS